MDRFRVDLLHTWRGLRRRPGAAVATAVVLALGVGLASTIFAIADPFLWRPLPYPSSDRLVIIRVTTAPGGTLDERGHSSVPTLRDWQSRTDLFEAVAAYSDHQRVRLATGTTTVLVTLREVSENFLALLGVRVDEEPTFRPSPPGTPRPLVVAATAGDLPLDAVRELVGRTLTAEDGSLFRVLSSLPPNFVFPSPRVAFRPQGLSPADFDSVMVVEQGRTSFLTGVARLQSHRTAAYAQTALAVGAARGGLRISVEPLSSHMVSGVRPLALGGVGAGLMIAFVCAANLMNLVIVRGVYRGQEFATREALGASRLDLLRLVVVELVATTGMAIAGSLLLTRAALTVVAQVLPDRYAAVGQPEVTFRVALFSLSLGAVIVAASVLPAWLSSRRILPAAISRAENLESRAMRWLRMAMAGGQTAIATMLAVGGVFLATSYANLWLQETGYSRQARVVSVSYPEADRGAALMEEIAATIQALRRVPGIRSAAAGIGVGSLLDNYFTIGGTSVEAGGIRSRMMPAEITPGYFDVVGTRLLAGRVLGPFDQGWNAVVVNKATADLFCRGLPLARVVQQTISADGHAAQIVGVVENAHDRGLDQPAVARIYRPLGQQNYPPPRVNYVVRLAGQKLPDQNLRRAVAAVNRAAAVEAVDSIEGRLAEGVRDRSFATLILVLFAAAALSVTGTGIFGLVAFVVARRAREIAIRTVLGADVGQVRILVMREAVLAALVGCVAGLLAGRALAQTLKSFLFGVEAGDLTAPAVAAAVMVAITGAAAWWPARRALHIEPTLALRID